MSLKHVDIEAALRRLADRRIEDAIKEGKFDNLPGAGKPIELDPIPADEDARLMWWALRILRQNDVMPEEVRWRKTLDRLRGELEQARDETRVRVLVLWINQIVHRINTLGTNALNSPVVGVDLDEQLARLRARTQSNPDASTGG
ncbi:DUF1992 domain-containing protein [Fontivita pretiosa]|uniref:DnaJ family domain-containing protein n=1 Tax=Fontivita pretiosa TaxID=2989684 RepID=UPI003D16428C